MRRFFRPRRSHRHGKIPAGPGRRRRVPGNRCYRRPVRRARGVGVHPRRGVHARCAGGGGRRRHHRPRSGGGKKGGSFPRRFPLGGAGTSPPGGHHRRLPRCGRCLTPRLRADDGNGAGVGARRCVHRHGRDDHRRGRRTGRERGRRAGRFPWEQRVRGGGFRRRSGRDVVQVDQVGGIVSQAQLGGGVDVAGDFGEVRQPAAGA